MKKIELRLAAGMEILFFFAAVVLAVMWRELSTVAVSEVLR